MSPFSLHLSHPHLLPGILPPFGFVHVSFIHVPWQPFPLSYVNLIIIQLEEFRRWEESYISCFPTPPNNLMGTIIITCYRLGITGIRIFFLIALNPKLLCSRVWTKVQTVCSRVVLSTNTPCVKMKECSGSSPSTNILWVYVGMKRDNIKLTI